MQKKIKKQNIFYIHLKIRAAPIIAPSPRSRIPPTHRLRGVTLRRSPPRPGAQAGAWAALTGSAPGAEPGAGRVDPALPGTHTHGARPNGSERLEYHAVSDAKRPYEASRSGRGGSTW